MISRRDFTIGSCATALAFGIPIGPIKAWPVHGGGTAFNGKKVQTNTPSLLSGYDYPFLNALKTAQFWTANNNTALIPSDFDANGYPTTTANNNGVFAVFFIPSSTERAGFWVLDWTGDGTVSTASMNASAYTNQITAVSQVGGAQTLTLANTPSPWLVANMAVAITGFSGGTWAGLNATWPIASVNSGANQITINTGTTFTGSPTISGSAKVTSVTTTTTSSGLLGQGRYVLQTLDTGIGGSRAQVEVVSVSSSVNYPSNIRFYHIDDTSAINAGQVFSSIAKSHYSNFGVIRHLGWQNGNTTNVTNWASRKPQSYVYYNGSQMRSDLYCGTTTVSQSASGLAYAVSFPSIHSSNGSSWSSGGPSDKDTIQIVFGSSCFATLTAAASDGAGNTILTFSTGATDATFVNGASVRVYNVANGTGASGWTGLNGTWTVSSVSGNTLKIPVNSSGFTGSPSFSQPVPGNIAYTAITVAVGGGTAITINDAYSNAISNRTDNFPQGGSTNSLATLVYDATLNVWIKQGGDSEVGAMGINNAVPPEIAFRLCNEIGAHPYFVTPPLAIDPATDWLPELMNYCRLNAPSWMKPRFEGPNELWNTASGFYQTFYANNKAAAYGWGSSGTQYGDWYGKVMSVMGQIGAAVYGQRPGASNAYYVLCGVQTVSNTGGSVNAQAVTARMESTSFFNAGVAPSPLTWSGGTITFTASRAAGTTAQGGATATNYISALCCAQYFNDSVRSATAGTVTQSAMASAFSGSQFYVSSIVNGLMTVVVTGGLPFKGAALTAGATIFGANMPSGITIASLGTGTGGAGTYQLSDSTININYQQSYYAGVDMTQPPIMSDTVVGTVVNATISGNQFTINSVVSGSVITNQCFVVGGTVALSANIKISSGSASPFTLSGSPGNQTANFTLSAQTSIPNLEIIYGAWATFATNHNVNTMFGYEGCYSPDYNGGAIGSATENFLFAQSRWNPNLSTYYKKIYDDFTGIGAVSYPGGFTAAFPSLFSMTGAYPSTGIWQTLEDIYVSPQPPAWAASAFY